MSNTARKARKRAREPFVRTAKRPTRPWSAGIPTLGLVSGAEILAGIVIRGRL